MPLARTGYLRVRCCRPRARYLFEGLRRGSAPCSVDATTRQGPPVLVSLGGPDGWCRYLYMHLAGGITLMLRFFWPGSFVRRSLASASCLSLSVSLSAAGLLPTPLYRCRVTYRLQATSSVPTPRRLPRPRLFCSSCLPLNSYLRPSSQRRLNVTRNRFSVCAFAIRRPIRRFLPFDFVIRPSPSHPPDGSFPCSNARAPPAFATSALLCSAHDIRPHSCSRIKAVYSAHTSASHCRHTPIYLYRY